MAYSAYAGMHIGACRVILAITSEDHIFGG